MKFQKMLLWLAALCAAGCMRPSWLTVGPDYEEPEVVAHDAPPPDAGYPTTNKTATGEFAPATTNDDPRMALSPEAIVCWWCRFDDPILTNLVSLAASNNLSFAMAKARLMQSRWLLLGKASSLVPHLDMSGSARHSEAHRNNSSLYSSHKSSGTRASHTDLFKGGFDATWEIDIFGGVSREVESAYASVESAEYSLADAWVSLTSEIGSSYIQLRTIQERLKVARTNLKLQSETYDILKSRLDSGIGDELAVNQAKYNVEQTRASIPNLLSQEESFKNSLAVLCGMMPGALHDELQTPDDRDWLIAPQRLDSIPLDLMRNRPDVRSVERALAAQVASVGVATSYLYPKLYLNGSLGLESVKIQKFTNRGSLYSWIGPSFSWPIFQGGNLIANLKAEESKMDEAVLKYELAMQNAFAETRNAYSAYTQEYHRYQSLQGAVKAAQDAVNISQDLYKNGLADFNNVLDAQRSLLTLEEALTISRGKITEDLIALFKALGGGLAM
ncbi:MAG: efflux transporter outer membrane subunit [Kiritimatiellae bacterium]|nr:efflux transporter outer membrane subunit [Kiritimatiellia bacterium]